MRLLFWKFLNPNEGFRSHMKHTQLCTSYISCYIYRPKTSFATTDPISTVLHR